MTPPHPTHPSLAHIRTHRPSLTDVARLPYLTLPPPPTGHRLLRRARRRRLGLVHGQGGQHAHLSGGGPTSYTTTSAPHLTSTQLTSPHLTSPPLTSPHLTSPHLTSPHLTSPHLTSPHLTSSSATFSSSSSGGSFPARVLGDARLLRQHCRLCHRWLGEGLIQLTLLNLIQHNYSSVIKRCHRLRGEDLPHLTHCNSF